MTIQKQNINIPFVNGLETKTDPKQVSIGKFLLLKNSVFDKQGLLKKRNGYGKIATIEGASNLATFNDSLLAIGTSLTGYNPDSNSNIDGGVIQPLSMSTQSLVRSATSQTNCDVAVNSLGLACSVWLDSDTNSYYQISDSTTGQTVVPKVQLPSTATQARVCVLGSYFVITFLATVAAASHLQYIAVPMLNPSAPLAAVDLSTQVNTLAAGYDIIVANNTLYVAWVSNVSSNVLKVTTLSAVLVQGSVASVTGETGELVSITADLSTSNPTIWVSIYKGAANTIRAAAYDYALNQTLAPATVKSSITINEITSVAVDNVLTVFYEVANTYSFTPNDKTDYIAKNTITIAGSVGTASTILRSVGLASKANFIGSTAYMLVCYGGSYQPSYFLIDSSGNIIAKLAYSNGGGYAIDQVLPQLNVFDSTVLFGYLFKDLLAAVNRDQGVANTAGIYSQTGINVASITLNSSVNTAEIGSNLHISGGLLWMYDGVKAVEHGFNVWPEGVTATASNSTGTMTAQQYYYQVCYEWTDNQGNIHRSAPSIPVGLNLIAPNDTVTLNIPTLRLTYKTSNKVRVVVYRWSAANQSYYRITSITSPLLNDPTVDSVSYVDLVPDSSIIGNDLIYTTGGVVENIAAPSFTDVSLFKSRIFGIDSENQNSIWYSKLVVQNTPAEFSDLFTIYVAPTTGVQGSTGVNKALASLDDKFIIFKENAIYYITGSGADATGANNDFSEPIFITSSVGCSNPKSIAMIPQGLIFQSNKGIWLLGRDLSTQYIGAPVEAFNNLQVLAATSIPATNQVRFNLDDGSVLMYDYYYDQWGEFQGIEGISSTIYNGLQTFLKSSGEILQETPSAYFDGSRPVLLSFKTSWLNLAGLQGYQRAYFFYILGQFLSPHKILIQIAYDYSSAASQSLVITPDNYSAPWGSDEVWGQSSPWGGIGDVEQWRVFFQQQKCQAFQISLSEIYDPFYDNTNNNAGLTISGLNLVFGSKKGYKPILAQYSRG